MEIMDNDRSTKKKRPHSSYDPPLWNYDSTLDDERISWLPAHLRSNYTSHLRSASRVSWDGQDLSHLTQPLPSSRTPSPSPSRHRLNRPRSVGCLPEYASLFPNGATNRWSYDRERMPPLPSLPPPPRSQTPLSRPTTPMSYFPELSSRPSSRTASLSRSRTPSRPLSVHLDDTVHFSSEASTPYFGAGACTPTLRVTHPDGTIDTNPADPSQLHLRQQQHQHIEEKQPLGAKPMISQASTTDTIKEKHNISTKQRRMSVDSEIHTPGCCGLCEQETAKAIGGNVAAWMIGTLLPVTFGLATKFLAGLCR